MENDKLEESAIRINFLRWVEGELSSRGWSQRELERRSGVSNTLISNIRAGIRSVTWDTCASIARAFEQTPESAFRLVGLLPTHKCDVEVLREILNYLSERERNEVLRYANWKRRETEASCE